MCSSAINGFSQPVIVNSLKCSIFFKKNKSMFKRVEISMKKMNSMKSTSPINYGNRKLHI